MLRRPQLRSSVQSSVRSARRQKRGARSSRSVHGGGDKMKDSAWGHWKEGTERPTRVRAKDAAARCPTAAVQSSVCAKRTPTQASSQYFTIRSPARTTSGASKGRSTGVAPTVQALLSGARASRGDRNSGSVHALTGRFFVPIMSTPTPASFPTNFPGRRKQSVTRTVVQAPPR